LRESNAGLRVYRKGEPDERLIKGNWPALVAEGEWRRVAALLTAHERRVARPANRQHLLTWGIGECGVCGGYLRMARKGAAGKAKAALYVCAEKGCTGRNQAQVDALVRAVVIERLSRPDALRWLTADDRALAEVAERAQAARRKLDEAAAAFAADLIDAGQLAVITAEARPRLEAAEAERRRLTAAVDSTALAELAGPEAAQRWDSAPVTTRRTVLKTLDLRVRLLPVRRRGPGFDPETVAFEWTAPRYAHEHAQGHRL
jgi:site-specific DNA recombinase